MWAHLFRDPAPRTLVQQRAPRVGRWVERMTTSEPYVHEYATDGRDAGGLLDEIPETLVAMMRFVGDEYLPEITAHVEAANEWLAAHPDIEPGTNGLEKASDRSLTGGPDSMVSFDWRGQQLTTQAMPYRVWLLQRLHDDLAAAPPRAQDDVRKLFASAGLEPILDLRTLRRVERKDHLEVWGPVDDG